MDFEEIRDIGDLERVSFAAVWQNFERLAAFIFEKNDFSVAVGTVRTLKRQRRQYDVIAKKSDWTFLVECKKWARTRHRLSGLKRAVLQHKERAAFYEAVMDEDAVPVIVTLIEEEVHVYGGVPIVPVIKLNSFISELDLQAGGIAGYSFDDYPEVPDEDLLSGAGGFPVPEGEGPC